jgi:hypothetical protein
VIRVTGDNFLPILDALTTTKRAVQVPGFFKKRKWDMAFFKSAKQSLVIVLIV